MIRFIPLANLSAETARWVSMLRDYGPEGDILTAGRHIVFANDADGTHWILDAESGVVASFYWKGGSWEEPTFQSFDAFMGHIFDPQLHDKSWATVLQALV